MDLKLFFSLVVFSIANASISDTVKNSSVINNEADSVFNGVYSECFLHLSYSCLQKKTLLYLKELNNLSEVSVIGDYVKFVKINKSINEEENDDETKSGDSEELASMIDQAIDNFFDNHVLKFYALGRNISMPRNVEEFVGRKKRKGGGGGGGGGHGGGGGGGHDDGGKKKMMMMAMMCMKMKLMMMVPAMMGMMGMMSFKGMMFSMMSFMISKMMLLMKILEKKGGGGLGGGGGGGLDGGWAAGGAGGGAWMPAGGQDYAGGGGGGGGYDANGQWQSRSIVNKLDSYTSIDDTPIVTMIRPVDSNDITPSSIKWQSNKIENKPGLTLIHPLNYDQWQSRSIDKQPDQTIANKPEISFVNGAVRYNNNMEREPYKKPVLVYKRTNVNFDFDEPENLIGQGYENVDDTVKSNTRLKRDIELQRKVLDQKFKWNLYNNDDKRKINEDINTDNSNIKTENLPLKLRKKRSIIDLLQNSYIYWVNKILGLNNNRRTNLQKYKIVNGIKYIYHPIRMQKPKMPKEIQMSGTLNEDLKPLVAVEEFNKGEIVEGGIESRMIKKKFNKMKDSVNDTVDDNPWE